jgi:hypothetical protein
MPKFRKEEPVRLSDCECTAETERAILVEVNAEEMWFPKTQIDESSEVTTKGDRGVLVISNWIAKQKNLI